MKCSSSVPVVNVYFFTTGPLLKREARSSNGTEGDLRLSRFPPIAADFMGMFHLGKGPLDRNIGLFGQIGGTVPKRKHGTHELLELLPFFSLKSRSFHFQRFCFLHFYSLSSD